MGQVSVRGFPGYTVDEDGNVYSSKIGTVKRLSWCPIGAGYRAVSLRKDGKTFKKYVHRIVAENFLEGWDESLEVNHKNGDKNDNNLKNLELVTHKENMRHSFRSGLNAKPGGIGLLSSLEVSAIRFFYSDSLECNKVLAKAFKRQLQSIHNIGKCKTHKEVWGLA